MYCFAVLGLFASSIGALIPSIRNHYSLSISQVSTLFIPVSSGYVLASQCNSYLHARFGQVGVATIGPVFHVLSACITAAHPPFSLILAAFALQGMGTGLLDGSWCAWAGARHNANTISGWLHGSFSLGAAVGPLFTTVVKEWWQWYYVLAAASVFELVLLFLAFRKPDSAASQAAGSATETTSGSYMQRVRTMLRYRATWISAAYFLAYVGTETAAGGWIDLYMLLVHQATVYEAVRALTAFWASMAIGRVCLGPVTDRLGVVKAVIGYMLCVLALELSLAASKSISVSVTLMGALGFLMGPLFPSGVVLLTRHLPSELHVQTVSTVASVGQIGAALLPGGIGVLMQAVGMAAFPFALAAFSGVTLGFWVVFSMLRKRDG